MIGKIKGIITCILFCGCELFFIDQAGRVLAPPQAADIANRDVSATSCQQNLYKSPYADNVADQHNSGRSATWATAEGK